MSVVSSLMELKKRLEGKVAIITGGASGIGASTAHLFWENGATVIIADINDKLGQAISDKLGHNISYIHCDVTNEDDVRNLIDTTIEKHKKLDIMYNNAGIIDGVLCSILDTNKSDLDRVINVNLIGAFLGAKHAARVMVPQKKGCILFTGSACTSTAGISTHSYAASKYGILGLAKNLAGELGKHNVRVNCVSPFAVMGTGITSKPEMSEDKVNGFEAVMRKCSHLKDQLLKPDGVAQAALYLVSDEASYVSGLNLVVDGGFSVLNPTLLQTLNLI